MVEVGDDVEASVEISSWSSSPYTTAIFGSAAAVEAATLTRKAQRTACATRVYDLCFKDSGIWPLTHPGNALVVDARLGDAAAVFGVRDFIQVGLLFARRASSPLRFLG